MQPTHSHAPQAPLALPRPHDTLRRLCPSRRPPEVVRARSRSRSALLGASMRTARLQPRAPSAAARLTARLPRSLSPELSYRDSRPCSRPKHRLTCGGATQRLGQGLGAEPRREIGVEGADAGAWRARKPSGALRRRRLCPEGSSMLTRGVPPARIWSRLRSSAPEPAKLEKRLMGRGMPLTSPGQLGASIPGSTRDGERETGIQEACSTPWGRASSSFFAHGSAQPASACLGLFTDGTRAFVTKSGSVK